MHFTLSVLNIFLLRTRTPYCANNTTSLGLQDYVEVSLMSSLNQSSLTSRTAQICSPSLFAVQSSLPMKTTQVCLLGSHPALATIFLNCEILAPSGHCAIFLLYKDCAKKFLSRARAMLYAVSVINPFPCHM